MTSETAGSTTIQEALDRYVRDIKTGAKSKGKSSGSNKPIDPKALQHFARYFQPDTPLHKLTKKSVNDYGDHVNGNGTVPEAEEHLRTVKRFLEHVNKSLHLTEDNLAPSVRIRKPRARSGATIVSSEAQPIELTAEGHAQLVEQRARLITEREALVEEIRRARADGDVTENSPLDAAREEQGRVDARIQEITSTLEKSVIIAEGQARENKVVKIGARVEVKDLSSDRDPRVYTLVNKTEANPLALRISDDSPMGKSLLGKRVGEEVSVDTPRGNTNYKVISIS